MAPSLVSLAYLACTIPLTWAASAPAGPAHPPLLTALGQDADLSKFYSLFTSTGGGKPAPELEERFNNPRDGLFRVVLAPTNRALAALPPTTLARLARPSSYELLVALLRTHLTDAVDGRLLSADKLLSRNLTSVEGFQLAVGPDGSIVSNPGLLKSDPDNQPLSAPQASLVRSKPSGPFLPAIQAANGAIFKIDAVINPFATYFGRDRPSPNNAALPAVQPRKDKSATMADVLSSDPDLSALHTILAAVAPDFLQRLALFSHDVGSKNPANVSTVFLAPANAFTRSKVDSASRPFNAGLSRELLTGGFGEIHHDQIAKAAIAVQGDMVGNAKVVRRVKARNGEVWITKRWLDPMI
ncbi:hypothetical protein E4U43_002300 [Claviceps pusilla]|uniref:FAS1 domain-containing protein n=1 Tax=Claviceps pusilla TaxID=123648 RepID=A0A9P7N8J3_9HYPO|nr:hypothetical protein E4U43_002300 [Claviceps pusilla]